MFQSQPGIPDMLYFGRSPYGRSSVRCTGPMSCTAMCLCSIAPVVIFIATTLILYDISQTVLIVSYVLYGIASVLFIVMLILCIVTWRRGCEYIKQHPHLAHHNAVGGEHALHTHRLHHGRGGQMRTAHGSHQIHGVIPQPPPYSQQPPTLSNSHPTAMYPPRNALNQPSGAMPPPPIDLYPPPGFTSPPPPYDANYQYPAGQGYSYPA